MREEEDETRSGSAPRKEEEPAVAQQGSGWLDYFSKTATAYLPTQMNELLLREKSFATAHLPAIGTKNAVALPL